MILNYASISINFTILGKPYFPFSQKDIPFYDKISFRGINVIRNKLKFV